MEYGSHSVTIHTIDTSTIKKLGGITSMGMPLNTTITRDDSGSLYTTFGAINFQAPKPQFTTKSISLAIPAMGQTGICINSDVSHPGVALYGEAKGDCQEGEPGSGDHLQYLIDLGLMVPITLQGSRRDDMTLSVEIDAITDGTNAPFAQDNTATLPTSVDDSVFVIGAMRIGNLVWTDVRSMSLNFGIQRIEDEPQLGGIWPYRSGRTRAEPVMTITARDPTQVDDAAVPLLGVEATHANTILYFKKRKNRATFELDAATVHGKLTMAGIVVAQQAFSASGRAPAETTFEIHGVHDGTNAPLIFTFGVAYDASP